MVLSSIMLLHSFIALLKSKHKIYNANTLLQEFTIQGALICTIHFTILMILPSIANTYHSDGILTSHQVKSTQLRRTTRQVLLLLLYIGTPEWLINIVHVWIIKSNFAWDVSKCLINFI
jgi:hypothetical protein